MSDYDYDKFLNDSSDDYHHKEQSEILIGCIKQTEAHNEEALEASYKEVLRLSKCAIQPWWTEEYKASSEQHIERVEQHFEKHIFKKN